MSPNNKMNRSWDAETGKYLAPDVIWQVDRLNDLRGDDMPDIWLSRPDGEYYFGISFHFAPFTFPDNKGIAQDNIRYCKSPFLLNIMQDPFNSWGVNARLAHSWHPDVQEFWDWWPGVTLIDESSKYTLPHTDLASFAGTEWADNDRRVFCGFYDLGVYQSKIVRYLDTINRLTGPGWAGWPFGQRQLTSAVIFWIGPDDEIPTVLLQAESRQFGFKFAWMDRRLCMPSDVLGAWESRPAGWDCRRAIRFLYQAQLMAEDGLPEMALTASIAALENTSAALLLHLFAGDAARVEGEFKNARFLDRFDKILPKHGAQLPNALFQSLKQAYIARNGAVHNLEPVTTEQALLHVHDITDVLVWYWENVR